MLVIKRNIGDRTILTTPEGWRIEIVQLAGNRIGIEAAPEVVVLRAELEDTDVESRA